MAPHTLVPKPSYNELLCRIKELEDEQHSSMMRQLDEETGEGPDQANQELDNVFDYLNEQQQTQHVVKHKYHSKPVEKQPQQRPEESEDDDNDDDDEQPELDEHADDHQQEQRPAKPATPRSARRNPKTPNRQQ
ncbi:hypothetical protein KEM55_002568 [Ascosphaera atra]|nr:hypothetical protein KEM55_002568 [Ascosphaera atra]